MKLIFVYNADSGLFNQVTDAAHKIFLPETYQCALCQLTYGNFSIKKEWKEFIESLDVETTFLHKDEFSKAYPNLTIKPPAILKEQNDEVELMISAVQLRNLSSLDELIHQVHEVIRKSILDLRTYL